MISFKKLLRTTQNYFPFLAERKNDFYHFSRRYLHMAHEGDFAVLRLLPRRADDLFLDVGGNRGQSILSIRKYRPDVPIVCFEPNPQLFPQLAQRFSGDPRLVLKNFGLGTAPQEVKLHLPSYRGFPYCGAASLSPDHARAVFNRDTIYGFDPRHVAVRELSCTLRTLDSLNLAPTFIKIDVEGFEHDVLLGGLETLRRTKPVLLLERSWAKPELFTTLAGLGYAEVRLQDGHIVAGRGRGENALMMMEKHLIAQEE